LINGAAVMDHRRDDEAGGKKSAVIDRRYRLN